MPEVATSGRPAVVEDRVELVHGFGLRVVARGWGDPLVWAHDVFSSVDDDDATPVVNFRRLATSARLIRYDAIGHGRSAGVAHAGDHTWESRGDDLLQLCERMRLPTAALGGFSVGAATALWAAHLAPNRVDRLILAGLPNGWGWRAPAAGVQGLMGMSALLGVSEPVRYALRYAPLPQYRSGTMAAYNAAHFRRVVNTPRARYIAALVGAARSNLPPLEALENLHVPTLVLAFPGDPLRPVRAAQRVAEALPEAELVLSPSDPSPAVWTDVIREFLD